MSVLIKGGRIVTAADDYVGDVFDRERDGRRCSASRSTCSADKVIDAAGKYVIPGAIDPHTHIEMFFGGTVTLRRLHVGHDLGGVRRHDDARRLLHAGAGHVVRPGARELPREDRPLQARDRRRLPHRRHRPARGRLARGARDAARPGRHLLQAVHGLQGRRHGRRRDAVQDDADRARDRRARDGARRERRRDRHHRQGGRRRRARRSRTGTRARARPRPRARRRTARSSSRASPAARSTSSTSPARSRSSRSRSRARRAGTSGARPAPSTCSSTSPRSTSPASRARSTSTRRRRGRRRTRSTSGTRCSGDVLSVVSTDHCPFKLARAEGDQRRDVPEGPERRPGDREPAAHAARRSASTRGPPDA